MYCARETMKQSKTAKENKPVDQKTNQIKSIETSNAIQDEKVNDADIDFEAGLFYAKCLLTIIRKIAQNTKENLLMSHWINLPT